jgi:hypothetical protein
MSLIDQILDLIDEVEPLPEKSSKSGKTGFSAYRVGKLLNKSLIAAGYVLEKEIPEQMMYNYAKAGLIDGIRHETGEFVRFDENEVIRFISAFIARYAKNHSKA